MPSVKSVHFQFHAFFGWGTSRVQNEIQKQFSYKVLYNAQWVRFNEKNSSVKNTSGGTLENNSSVQNNNNKTLDENSSIENNSSGTLENHTV